MKLLYLTFFALLSLGTVTVDPVTQFAELLGKGNSHEMARFFAPTIELTLMDDANTYSKAQAEIVLDKFFTQNKPNSSKMLHKINSNANFNLGVMIINTDKATYPAAFTLKDNNGTLQLIELRIEAEKVK